MFKRLFFSTASLLLPLALAQDAPKPPTFIDADVHVTPADYKDISPGALRDNQFELRGMTMLNLITRAYGSMEADRILGGPRRLELDRYDIVAKVPPGTKNDAIPAMLKVLLEDRFKLVVREEKRPLASFALTLGKGKHKLKPAEGSETRCGTGTGAGPAPAGPQTTMHLTCKGYSTTMLVGILRSLGSGFITGPVADQTGLQGNWDFEMDFAPPMLNQVLGGGGSGASMIDAVENQLGLKLEQKRTDQPVLVIASMNSVPTENAPGVAITKAAPAAQVELEVATIRPSAAGAPQGGFSIRNDPQGGMQFEARGMRLGNLITLAWDVPVDRLVGLPAGSDDQPYDIVAKIAGVPGVGLVLRTTIGPVLKGLLADRFKMDAHLEDRPVDAYKLVAMKPKMAKADPENRATCKSGPAAGAKDPREVTPGRTALYTCRNMTMEEFAERLQSISVGFIRIPVVDATKLEGMWDFTLNFTPQLPAGLLAAGVGPVAAGVPAPTAIAGGGGPTPLAAADPSDNITLMEAINSQLGLKLELEKRPMPVLVIDRLEKTPTEN